MPPESSFPDGVTERLYARARRVRESIKITTSYPTSTKRLASAVTSSATRVWWWGSMSKVAATTSARRTDLLKSVTSSGRSATKRIRSLTSG